MTDDTGFGKVHREEIEGAPPAYSSAEIRERRLAESTVLNRYLYLQSRQLELMLLDAQDLMGLLEVLLVSLPRHFSFRVSELWLYDPEDVLASLLIGAERYGHYLQLHRDAFTIQELYDLEPDIQLIDATDSRMFEVLKSEHGIDQALLLPLLDGGRLIGSLHLGIHEELIQLGDAEEDLLAHVAAIVSACFRNAVSRQQISSLIMLDPLTHISNLRGFELDIAREIARARRTNQPVSVLVMDVDEYDELYDHYGETRGQFVLKKVAERVSSDLRATDMMARLSRSRLAVLIPGSGESLAEDIAQRMRGDIEGFAIDDGRGAVLQVTLSIGTVTWEPQQYPAVDMPQLARQMETVGSKALQAARAKGGNSVAVGRLSTLMV